MLFSCARSRDAFTVNVTGGSEEKIVPPRVKSQWAYARCLTVTVEYSRYSEGMFKFAVSRHSQVSCASALLELVDESPPDNVIEVVETMRADTKENNDPKTQQANGEVTVTKNAKEVIVHNLDGNKMQIAVEV